LDKKLISCHLKLQNVSAIAQGTLVQLPGVTKNGINLSKTRFLVKVEKVLYLELEMGLD
jgi:hypothetical protein